MTMSSGLGVLNVKVSLLAAFLTAISATFLLFWVWLRYVGNASTAPNADGFLAFNGSTSFDKGKKSGSMTTVVSAEDGDVAG